MSGAPSGGVWRLVRRLVGAGADLFGLVPAQRNLEEVFLAMTQPEETPDA